MSSPPELHTTSTRPLQRGTAIRANPARRTRIVDTTHGYSPDLDAVVAFVRTR